ncbi:MAG: hypothetical protein JWQ09_4711 [Segetibacter sp.]|nr:hypothetical protein [Segetibacter sp.]
MQEDKFLKELLIKGGVEKASPDFTVSVMNRIEAINSTKVSHSSIINKRWKRIYKIAFVAIAFSIIIMSFLVNPSELPFTTYFKVPPLNEQIGYNIISYILSFWVFIFINQRLLNKNYVRSIR